MADPDPLSEIFTMFAAPVAGTIRSFEQFRKGVDEFLRGVENFNRTMENLNETSERINALLAEVEEPLRAAIPQVTRTVRAADEMMQVVSGPAMAVAPGLTRLADTLGNPAFQQLPSQVGQLTELLGELSKRLTPLGQIAESAGGLFGLRLPGFPPSRSTSAEAASPADTPATAMRTAPTPAAEPPAAGRPAAKTTATKTTATKKNATKKNAAKRAATRKPAAKKTAAKR